MQYYPPATATKLRTAAPRRCWQEASPLTHQGLVKHSRAQYDRRCLNNTACLFSVLKPHFRLKISKFMELLWSFPLPRLAKWKPNWNFIIAQNKSFAHAKRELFAKRLQLILHRISPTLSLTKKTFYGIIKNKL